MSRAPCLSWSGSRAAQEEHDKAMRDAAIRAQRRKAGESKRPSKRRNRRRLGQFVGTYRDYLDSPQWRKKRRKAIAIAGGRCSICGSTERLDVHHIHYRTLFRENPASDLRVLCRDCHANEHEPDKGTIDSVTAEYLERCKSF